MRSLILGTIILFQLCKIQPQNWDPNAKESGKIWDFRSFDYNMYWPLLNMYSENFGFGPGGFSLLGGPLLIGRRDSLFVVFSLLFFA